MADWETIIDQHIRSFLDRFQLKFNDPSLIQRALTHRSVMNHLSGPNAQSNERLEFLGDAVLDLIVSDFLYRTYPDHQEGELTKTRAILISRKVHSELGRQMNLGQYVIMDRSIEKTGGRNHSGVNADAYEAIVAALYLDQGLESAKSWVQDTLLSRHTDILNEDKHRNFKSELLELLQGRNLPLPEFQIDSEVGPEHDKEFSVAIYLGELRVGSGDGKSKKQAEQAAAKDAIRRIQAREVVINDI